MDKLLSQCHKIHVSCEPLRNMAYKFNVFLLLVVLAAFIQQLYARLSLASYYGNHMVLQKAPKSSYLWGYADLLGEMVTVTVGEHGTPISTIVYREESIPRFIWKVMLPPQEGPGPVNIYIKSTEGSLNITDVMFGDVWICSGQSNMQFTLNMVFNFGEEVADAIHYPDIRLFTAARNFSAHQQYDLLHVEEHWSRPNQKTVGHSNWSYFSAVCWLFGKYLYQHLKYPIGLIATDWGGTPIEAWSSKDAMDACGRVQGKKVMVTPTANQHTPTYLWNAMVHPLLNLTIYGAIWYQGEANAKSPYTYACRFPAMIDDWRSKFHQASDGQTDEKFPFGFVQLAPNRNNASITTGFPDIRWHQTADMGFVPNARMPNTFMAVAMDLPDFSSPFGSVHPRDKQDVASRLVLSALPVAYNNNKLGKFQGPQISAYYIDIGYHTLTVQFDNNTSPISVKSNTGFEVCCSHNNQSKCDGSDSQWIAAPLISHSSNNVTMKSCVNQWTMGIRYAWLESPCQYVKTCAVYSVENDLPMAPFISVALIGYT